MGYNRAGFEVIGVDIDPQPRYPFEFRQADALTYPLDGFDAIHASPVCKRWSQATRTGADPESYPDQLTPIRQRLRAVNCPYVIENVPGAPLVDPVVLCGSMFALDVRRHRHFEANWPLGCDLPCVHHMWTPRFAPNRSDRKKRPHALASVIVVAGGGSGGYGGRVADWRIAMGIEWMTRKEMAQAIPPIYTEFVGHQLATYVLEQAP